MSSIDALGHVPLPPYIHRDDTAADRERYQTVSRGTAVPSPHPPPACTSRRAARRVPPRHRTRRGHVARGYGTFKPVTADRVEDHLVDAEPYSWRRPRLQRSVAPERKDDASWRSERQPRGRWRPRRAVAAATCGGERRRRMFIYPGFDFRVVGGLVTNFHLPKSSLLMLVAAFAGQDEVLRAYRPPSRRGTGSTATGMRC